MILHRFMSEREYEALMAGEVLTNTTDHGARGQKTDSVGFCFFAEQPDEAIHWLSGCTYPDRCVTMEISDGLLTESYGTYRDPKRDDLFATPIGAPRPTMRKREYCLQRYQRGHGVQVISSTDRYHEYADIRRSLVALGIM